MEAAYDSACKHFQMGINQLGTDGWQRWYNLTFELYTEAAETACLNGDLAMMEQLLQQALQEAKSLIDTVKLHEIQMHASIVRNEPQEALNVGLETLRLLELTVPGGQVENVSMVPLLKPTLRRRFEQTLLLDTRKLVILNKMSTLLRVCHTEAETYRVVVDTCRELFPESAGCVCMMDEAQIMLKSVASWGEPPLQVVVFGVNESWGFYRGYTEHDEADDINMLYTYLGYAPEDGYLCIPVNASERTIASISLCSGACPPEQSNDEWQHIMELRRTVLTGIADLYAFTLENLRLRTTLRIESIRDPLTNLYNRRHMEESLRREIYRAARQGYPVSLIMLDIDHFASFNEAHGDQAGNVVLKELAALLLRHTRGEDIVCRYGEEEFFLILPDMPIEVAKIRAEELRVLIKGLRVPYSKNVVNITISLGVAALSGQSPDSHAGIAAAQRALNEAKYRGCDQVVVAPC